MSDLYEKSIIKLELTTVLQRLAACAGSEGGKAACMSLHPESDPEDVEALQEQTSAAVSLYLRKGNLSFADAKDVSASLDRADRGGSLQPGELLAVARALRCARAVHDYLSDNDEPTVLDPLFHSLHPNKHLEERIGNAILSEEEIADAASYELADIRRHMRLQSGKIRDSLQKVISSPAYSKFLREPIITIRQGRYVVPVKAECKNDVPGMVHDVSATGSTYFIEPMSAVSANNALRELEIKEEKEIARILSELSSEAAEHREDIEQNSVLLCQLDVIFAKAKLSCDMRAFPPVMNSKGKIELKNARHPLIDPQKAVPISLRLGEDFDTIIITGPNTGGKTVTLKTIGLLTLMAECGLHIPADEGSEISTFDAILADIGDEQSIAQSLSTFSGHMRSIVDIVNQCDSRTLVLYDELGAGTDPAEGAALAIALIEFSRKMGSRVAATTHYAELKLYAMRTQGVINASCEFDVDTLQPTYKLLIGIPGKSNAFAISRKLGLPEEILTAAGNLVGENDRNFEDILGQLERQRQQMEIARREAERLRSETAKIKQQNEDYQKQLQKEKEKLLESARREAQSIIDDARAAANLASEELKSLRRQLMDSADTSGLNQRQAEMRRMLNETEERVRGQQEMKARPVPQRAVRVGDTVELIKLGMKANVVEIGKDGCLLLQAGIMKVSAKPEEVCLIEEPAASAPKKAHPAHSGREMKLSAMPAEIDLRGMDSIEAVCVLERYLDEAMRAKLSTVRIIHGKGTGVLRQAVHQSLKKNRFIKKFRLGLYGEGEDGVTIVEF